MEKGFGTQRMIFKDVSVDLSPMTGFFHKNQRDLMPWHRIVAASIKLMEEFDAMHLPCYRGRGFQAASTDFRHAQDVLAIRIQGCERCEYRRSDHCRYFRKG